MKKLVLAIGLVAFLVGGIVTVQAMTSKAPNDKVITDDPPKAKKKSCTDYGSKKSCCSSKASCHDKTECKDKEGTKATSTTKETKKSSPDKK